MAERPDGPRGGKEALGGEKLPGPGGAPKDETGEQRAARVPPRTQAQLGEQADPTA